MESDEEEMEGISKLMQASERKKCDLLLRSHIDTNNLHKISTHLSELSRTNDCVMVTAAV